MKPVRQPIIRWSFAEGEILSGGNFHGAPLALALDTAAIALTTLMGIGERRIDRLVNPDINEGLPPFLSRTPGVSSGFMIAHIVAAALLNEAKVLAHPASADSVPTSGGKEDHVSMGMTAALKFRQMVENAERLLAIELLCAAQALEYRLPLKPARRSRARRSHRFGQIVRPLGEDRVLSTDIEALATAVRDGPLRRVEELKELVACGQQPAMACPVGYRLRAATCWLNTQFRAAPGCLSGTRASPRAFPSPCRRWRPARDGHCGRSG